MAAGMSMRAEPWAAFTQCAHQGAAMEAAHALGPAFLPASHPLTSDGEIATRLIWALLAGEQSPACAA
eukprot:6483074-Alexandrium_andersonii.AAC.1